MALIADHLNIRADRITPVADGPNIPGIARLGFEVELEGGDGRWPHVAGWTTTDDGSLRGNRIEYIFDGPLGGADAEAALAAFEAAMATYQPQPTFRCSTHVHMDMRLCDWNEYEKTVLAYMVFEDSFFDQADRYRRNSNFCIPFMNNDWFSAQFGRKVIAREHPAHKFDGVMRWTKYSALNLNVTAAHGSIEFRGSEALLTVEKLQALALRMLSIRKLATEHKAMSHFDFISMLLEANIHEVFIPGSFPPDYVMEHGAREQGFGSALNAVTQADLENNDDARAEARRIADEQLRQERREAERREANRARVRGALYDNARINSAAYVEANLATPVNGSGIANVINTVLALRGVGVDAIVRDFLQPSMATNQRLAVLRENFESLSTEWGYRNLQVNMLA
ncbi:amidoligase [Pseudomonas phage SCYZ1]|nr:amidoligase [Pseudomonas phage SCYZ1]